ncbi:hypothetical protein Agub_g14436, partial [Astrephomene gubernaculifera]
KANLSSDSRPSGVELSQDSDGCKQTPSFNSGCSPGFGRASLPVAPWRRTDSRLRSLLVAAVDGGRSTPPSPIPGAEPSEPPCSAPQPQAGAEAASGMLSLPEERALCANALSAPLTANEPKAAQKRGLNLSAARALQLRSPKMPPEGARPGDDAATTDNNYNSATARQQPVAGMQGVAARSLGAAPSWYGEAVPSKFRKEIPTNLAAAAAAAATSAKAGKSAAAGATAAAAAAAAAAQAPAPVACSAEGPLTPVTSEATRRVAAPVEAAAEPTAAAPAAGTVATEVVQAAEAEVAADAAALALEPLPEPQPEEALREAAAERAVASTAASFASTSATAAPANSSGQTPAAAAPQASSAAAIGSCKDAAGVAAVAKLQAVAAPTPTPPATAPAAPPAAAPPAPARAQAASVPSGLPATILLAVSPGTPPAMMRPSWSLGDYFVERRLYKSSTSSVYAAVCLRSGHPVALKVYNLNRVPANVAHMLMREIEIQSSVVHENITLLYAAFQDVAAARLVLVQEFASQGDLHDVHRALGCRMSEDQARVLVLRPLLNAVAHLHAEQIIHRDIKPENILFRNDWRLMLADFGVAINIGAERAVTRAGTVGYMAPEVERCPIKDRPEDNKHDMGLSYTTAADIWAIGCLAYTLLLGFSPYIAGSHASHGCSMVFSFPSTTSPQARDFITSALAERPEDRPTAMQLRKHAWICS